MFNVSPRTAVHLILRISCVAIAMLLGACSGQSGSDSSITNGSVPVNESVETQTDETQTDESPVDGEDVFDAESGGESADVETIPETVAVTFDITVPAYLSNELIVVVYSGEQSVAADYVSGQLWSATMNLPNIGRNAHVIFFDRFGDLALAGSRQRWIPKTSMASQEAVIGRVEFTLLDYDNDGTDNITELQLGTDPLIADSGVTPVGVSWQENDVLRALRGVTASYEIAVPAERPWTERIVEVPRDSEGDGGASRSVVVDIDISGNGEYRHISSGGNLSSDVKSEGSATRAVIDDAVIWDGQFSRVTFPEDNTTATFTSETLRYSERDYGQSGNFTNTNTSPCCLPGETEVEYSVIGSTPDVDGFCNVSYGSITSKRTDISTQVPTTTTSYTRANALRSSKWRVKTTRNGVVFADYELNNYDDIKAQFYCEFADL
ncbi:hypothetical protein [Granulosicoccus antarcticus]|uniref:Uncharacterized protein n=1 Tax=Granulosicoccus antarcticus IMCC3135 TaxID=1192854 RepID=A0A2Z2P447_9GAMM|nr:hypothetical protein [Granulosicoccus antarcticus]ASJ76190.1 hypothetical protein IMCC3135_30705 [Granulosicoccus antarcticus IMCC3135]